MPILIFQLLLLFNSSPPVHFCGSCSLIWGGDWSAKRRVHLNSCDSEVVTRMQNATVRFFLRAHFDGLAAELFVLLVSLAAIGFCSFYCFFYFFGSSWQWSFAASICISSVLLIGKKKVLPLKSALGIPLHVPFCSLLCKSSGMASGMALDMLAFLPELHIMGSRHVYHLQV